MQQAERAADSVISTVQNMLQQSGTPAPSVSKLHELLCSHQDKAAAAALHFMQACCNHDAGYLCADSLLQQEGLILQSTQL